MRQTRDHWQGPLGEYLRRTGMRQRELARLVGVARGWPMTQGQVSRYARGDVIPSMAVRIALERATDGAVSVADWADYAEEIGRERVTRNSA